MRIPWNVSVICNDDSDYFDRAPLLPPISLFGTDYKKIRQPHYIIFLQPVLTRYYGQCVTTKSYSPN